MCLLDERRFRADVDAGLDDLAPRHTEIVPLEISAPDARGLLVAAGHGSSLDLLLADIAVARRVPLVSLGQARAAA
jgi:hypothetical protein